VASRIDFDFSAYVAARKGEAAARAREGAAYAYGGDLKVRAALDRVRPVTLAMEAGVRFWHSVGKNRLLGNAVRVSTKQFPEVAKLVDHCAEALQIEPPALYISPKLAYLEAETLGTSDEVAIVLGTGLCATLSPAELTAVIGHGCGSIQNNHVPYLTAMYLLRKGGSKIVRWAAQPALLGLRGWARRAEITCDRAALLCTRRIDATVAAMVKRAVGTSEFFATMNIDEYLRQLDEEEAGRARFGELWAAHPTLPKRVKALRLFAETTYFRSVLGADAPPEIAGAAPATPMTKEDCDAKVAELLAVLT
jgi:Zn-dependent protease with chaperone function